MANLTAPPHRRARLLLPILGMLSACASDSTPTEQSRPNGATAATAFVPPALLQHGRPAPAQPGSGPLASGCSEGCPADSVIIDFEGLGGAGDVLLLQDQYGALGLHFSNAIVAIIPGFNYDEFPPRSGVASATADPFLSGDGSGTLFLSLDSVAIRVRGYITSVSPLTLRCFDAGGSQLAETVFPGGNLAIEHGGPANQLVEVSAPGIRSCQFLGPDNQYSLDDLTVVWNEGEAPELTCDSVFRGVDAECRVSGVSTVLGWHFEGILGARLLGQDSVVNVSSASSDTVWSGPGVLTGKVSVKFLVGGAPDTLTLTADWTVRSRTEPDWTGPAWRWDETNWAFQQDGPPICQYSNFAFPLQNPHPGRLAMNRRRSSCDDVGSIEPDLRSNIDAGTTVTPVGSGPNQGLWYVTEATFHLDRVTEMNPSIRPGWPTHQLFHLDQRKGCAPKLGLNGNPPISVNLYIYNTICEESPLDLLYAGLWAHEGFGINNQLDSATANGHEARRRIAARDIRNDPRAIVEPLVLPGPSATSLKLLIESLVLNADVAIFELSGDEAAVKDNFLDPSGGCGRLWVFSSEVSPARYIFGPLVRSVNGTALCF